MEKPVLDSPAVKESSLAVFLRSAVLAQRIYPFGSPIVERAVAQIQSASESVLKTLPRVTLTNRQGRLFVNGREEADAAALSGVFQDQGIQSLTFLPGVSAAEISTVVRLLGQRRTDGGKFADLLVEQKVVGIQADKTTVVEIEDGEVVTKKLDDLFAHTEDFPSLVGSLREAYDMIDRVPLISKREELQSRLVKKISSSPSHLLKDLFENPLPKRMEDANLREDVLKSLTKDKVHDIFSEIGQWYENIRRTTSSEMEAVEKLTQLKGFLGKLLGSPASREVSFALYEELLQKGLITSIPEDVQRDPAEESLASQVDRLLAGPSPALLEKPAREKLGAIFGKLCAIGLFAQCRDLLTKLLDNFYQDSPTLRGLAVRAAGSVLEVLWRSPYPGLKGHLFGALRRLAEDERVAEVYGEISGVLSDGVVRLILEDKHAQAMETITLLRRHREDVHILLVKRNEIAHQALEKAARRCSDVLVEGLLSADVSRTASVRALLYAFGAVSAPCLVQAMKSALDLRSRRSMAAALRDLGDAGVQALAVELNSGLSTPALLNLISVLDEIPSSLLTDCLKALRCFPDDFVRSRVAQHLGRIGTERAGGVLIEFLDDNQEPVRLEAIRALGEIRHAPAVPALSRILRTGGVLQREEICIALGKIANDAAVPPLVEVLTLRGGFFGLRSGEIEETVRVRAAWALANVQTPLGKSQLKRLEADDNAQVRMIARQALDAPLLGGIQ